jgi:heptosyltransferase II
MNILVIRFSSMGDVILVTSLFSYLEKKYPGSKVYFLTDSRYAELFRDDNRIFKVVGREKKSVNNDFLSLLPDKFDRMIDLQNNSLSSGILKLFAPCEQTGRFDKRHSRRLLLLLTRINLYKASDSVALRYVNAAETGQKAAGILPPQPQMILNAQKSDMLFKSLFCNDVIRPAIALIPFSAWKNKEWCRQYYKTVGCYFHAKGWNIAVLGGPDDEHAAVELKKDIGEHCIALAGLISLYETACILTHCTLALGNDTGLSHLARACGVKTGIVFGSTTHHFGFFPFGKPAYRIFQAKILCRPCHPHGGNICMLGCRPCLKKIQPENVIKALDELYDDVSGDYGNDGIMT